MKRKTVKDYLNKRVGQLIILSKIPNKNGRTAVKCKCLICGREDYETLLGNILQKEYNSCGCLQYQFKEKNPKWQGFGEISGAVLCKIKAAAKDRKIKFNLNLKQLWNLFLKQERKCALSGVELKFPSCLRDFTQTASLDRIDSSKGYTIDNVQWIHKDINYMKTDLTEKEFLDYCYKIIKYRNYEPK